LDLLEFQGKGLFARHGVPVPEGKPARTVEEAAAAAEVIGCPRAIKAQVQIGGRGKLGGIIGQLAIFGIGVPWLKVAATCREVRRSAPVHSVHSGRWIKAAVAAAGVSGARRFARWLQLKG
jgi:hypothetical protein